MREAFTVDIFVLAAIAAALASTVATADTKTFSGTGNWNDTARWTPGNIVPTNGDDVIISGAVTQTNSTAELVSYTLNGTHEFSGTNTVLSAAVVTVTGTMTHGTNMDVTGTRGVYADWTPDNRIFVVCSNLTISSSGSINADAKGYQGGPLLPGYGPGAGGNAGGNAAGGGYGGQSAAHYNGDTTWVGRVYGTVNAPVDPGSGGSGNGGGGGRNGGAGGGAVRIDASGAVTNDGAITANGANGATASGGGSGGGIWLSCRTFSGAATGRISANGGNGAAGYVGSGGAGGRIAILYTPSAQTNVPVPGVILSTSGGTGGDGGFFGNKGQDGTLYVPDALLLKDILTDVIRNVRFLGFSGWSPASLTLSGANIGFETPNFTLAVTNGNLLLTNSSSLHIVPGATNAVWTNCGALVSVTGNVSLATNCWVFPSSEPSSGASVIFRMANLSVASNAGFNADGKGYPGGVSGSPQYGYGPGGGKADASYAGGGGYGGNGGNPAVVSSTNYGYAYGSASLPLSPGSGGAGNLGGGSVRWGGYGGGLIWIEATNRITLDGRLTANGQNGPNYSGAGSGGGIYVSCRTIAGTNGYLGADGGIGANGSAGGGGGRIALLYHVGDQSAVSPAPVLRLSAGPGYSTVYPGEPGTLYLTNNSFFPTPVIRDSGGILIPGFTNWALDQLTLSNAWIRFPNGMRLTVTNQLLISGYPAFLDLTNSPTADCGSLLMTNSARLRLYSGVTNGTLGSYGALLNVAGDMALATNCWVYSVSEPTNGGSPFFQMRNLFIATNAGFSANSGGYPGGGLGQDGTGPGKGKFGPGSSYSGGGGYGGTGGYAIATTYGWTYGSSNAPANPGSGSAGLLGGADRFGAKGGGVVRIEALLTVWLNGVLQANGQDGPGWGTGGGSGGSIHIRCKTFAGQSGSLVANGGNGYNSVGGGGGGGRIAIWCVNNTSVGATATANGGIAPGTLGGAGTIVWSWLAAPGTIFVVH